MTDAELAAGIAHLPHLRRLDLVGCRQLWGRAFVALRHCSRLRHLGLESCRRLHFTKIDRRQLWPLRHVGSLATLLIVHWPGVDSEEVTDLQAEKKQGKKKKQPSWPCTAGS